MVRMLPAGQPQVGYLVPAGPFQLAAGAYSGHKAKRSAAPWDDRPALQTARPLSPCRVPSNPRGPGRRRTRPRNGRDDPTAITHQEKVATARLAPGACLEARAVIDASGTWSNPNPIGSGGVPAPGEAEAQEHIFYGIPDVLGRHKSRYAGKRTLVVGSGHSAINVLLELIELSDENPETEIFWALRKKQMQWVYGGESADSLPARGALGSRIRAMVEADRLKVISLFHISLVTAEGEGLHVAGKLDDRQFTLTGVDEIIANTGSRPDTSISREVRVAFDPVLESVPALAPLIDPNVHSCGTVRPHGEADLRQPEKDYYVVGVKSYGRAPTFLLATGHEQVRSIAAALTGNWEEAARVELSLPECGVCSSDLSANGSGAPCCGTLEASKSSPSQNSGASCCGSAQPIAFAVGGRSSKTG